jgi:hypothetical protein
MRIVTKSLLITFGLYVLFMIISYFTADPLAVGWTGFILLPFLAIFLFIGWIIGFIIEKIKGYKSKQISYVGWAGLIFSFVALLLSLILPAQSRYLIFGNPQLFYWPFWGFAIGALVGFIIEKIKR